MNNIASIGNRYFPLDSLPPPPPLSAFDLDPDARLGLEVLWSSTRVDWITKSEQLHGALLILPTSSPLRAELRFLTDLCWHRAALERCSLKQELSQ